MEAACALRKFITHAFSASNPPPMPRLLPTMGRMIFPGLGKFIREFFSIRKLPAHPNTPQPGVVSRRGPNDFFNPGKRHWRCLSTTAPAHLWSDRPRWENSLRNRFFWKAIVEASYASNHPQPGAVAKQGPNDFPTAWENSLDIIANRLDASLNSSCTPSAHPNH